MGIFKQAGALTRFFMDCGFWRSRRWAGATLAEIGAQVVAVSYCYEHGTDGIIPGQKDDLALALGVRERDLARVLPLLERRDIWSKKGDHYEVVGFLDHNPSRNEAVKHRSTATSKAQEGNHVRWHVKRGVVDPACALCRSPDDSPKDSPDESANESHPGVPQRIRHDSSPESKRREEKRRSNGDDPPGIDDGAAPGPKTDDKTDGAAPQDPSPNRRTVGAAVAEMSDIAGAVETEAERRRAADLAERLCEVVKPNQGALRPEVAVRAIWWALSHLDATVVDEVIGACAEQPEPPRTVKYVTRALHERAGELGIEMDEWRPRAPVGESRHP